MSIMKVISLINAVHAQWVTEIKSKTAYSHSWNLTGNITLAKNAVCNCLQSQ